LAPSSPSRRAALNARQVGRSPTPDTASHVALQLQCPAKIVAVAVPIHSLRRGYISHPSLSLAHHPPLLVLLVLPVHSPKLQEHSSPPIAAMAVVRLRLNWPTAELLPSLHHHQRTPPPLQSHTSTPPSPPMAPGHDAHCRPTCPAAAVDASLIPALPSTPKLHGRVRLLPLISPVAGASPEVAYATGDRRRTRGLALCLLPVAS
jgi:hypothetical protein